MALIHDNFLLENNTAEVLYNEYASDMPIFDYHCHLNADDILKNSKYANITRVWLDGDHYKWRLLRTAGVEEKYITGEGQDYEKFLLWSDVVGRAVGNPLYHWAHLELKRFFGIEEMLNKNTAPFIWQKCNELLKEDSFKTVPLLEKAKVKGLCTVNDPSDDLKSHGELEKSRALSVRVLPTFRPDKAFQIGSADFPDWLEKLEKTSGVNIRRLDDLEEALNNRCRHFIRFGCLSADQSIEQPDFTVQDRIMAEGAFQSAISGKDIGKRERAAYQFEVMLFLGRIYYDLDLVMQLHLGTARNINETMFRKMGPDTGFDTMGEPLSIRKLAPLFNVLFSIGKLPRAIIFTSNGGDHEKLSVFSNCFPEAGMKSKVQIGAAWWFLDHKEGMEAQLKSFCRQGMLSDFVGMLTDSRCILSMSRHEYFRRVLCNLLGKWVENGEIHNDKELLGDIIKDVCYRNAIQYFKFTESKCRE